MSARAATTDAAAKAGPCPLCAAEEKSNDCCAAKGIVRRAGAVGASLGTGMRRGVPALVDRTLRRPGRALDGATRAGMEAAFGHALGQVPGLAPASPAATSGGALRLGSPADREEHEADHLADLAMAAPRGTAGDRRVDFGAVRIHDGEDATLSAAAIGARAYAVGRDIVFAGPRHAYSGRAGHRLLAHELAHTLQAGAATVRRDGDDSVLSRAMDAADGKRWEEAARLGNGLDSYQQRALITYLAHQNGEFVWYLHNGAVNAAGVGPQSGIALATKAAHDAVQKKKDDAYQRQLAKENGLPEPAAGQPAAAAAAAPAPLTVAQKLEKCRSGETQGLKVFPLRMPKGMWRLDVAPISAHRAGGDIVVKQPLNGVWANQTFRKDTKTLPLQTFTGGLKLKPDDVVKVRVYDDNEKIICVTGEDMLKLSDATDTQMWLSVGRTVLDAASVMVPGSGVALSRGMSLAVGVANVAGNVGIEAASQQSMVNHGIKDKVDWTGLGFDAALQLLTLGVGGALTQKAESVIAAKVGGQFARAAITLAVKTVLAGGFNAFNTVAKQIFDRYRGERKEMTWGQLAEAVGEQFVMGALFEVVMSVLTHQAAAPHGEAPAPTGGKPTAGGHEPPAPAAGKPAAGAHDAPAAHDALPAAPAAAQKGVLKEEALAVEPIAGEPNGEHHEAVVTREGVARCSPSPCPLIQVEFAKELAANPDLQRRAEQVDALRKAAVDKPSADRAAAEAALLIKSLEVARNNAARQQLPGGEMPSNPDRGTTRAQWKAQESARRRNNAIDRAFDTQLAVPEVKGTEASGYTIDGRHVPQKQQRRVDIDAAPGGRDADLPKRPGETGRQAAQRVATVIGKRIGDFPLLKKLWLEARVSAETSEALSASNYKKLYDATRNGFWRRITANTAEGVAARALFDDAGLGFAAGKRGAARVDGVDPTIKRAETTVSLDHIQEKAIGDNWKLALDPDNLMFEFAMPNTNRENIQAGHGMRE